MTLADALAVESGDYVVSPYTTPPGILLRVTETSVSASGRFVYFRVHSLSGITAMAGGWVDSKALFLAPAGYTYDTHTREYVRVKKDKHGERTVVDRIAVRDYLAPMLEELAAVRRTLDGEVAA